MNTSTKPKRSPLWIVGAIILIGTVCLVWFVFGVSRSPELTIAISNYHTVRTQILVSVVFTNTSGRALVCAANSSLERLTPGGWTTSNFNNLSKPDPLTVPNYDALFRDWLALAGLFLRSGKMDSQFDWQDTWRAFCKKHSFFSGIKSGNFGQK
jgi:hypothetical protein